MKTVLILLIVLLIAVGLLLLDGGGPRNDAPVTGLPWQIERLPGGSTRVFGIHLGQTTLEQAIGQLGEDMELAIIAAPQEDGTLEAYYRHYAAGPVTGSLILVLDVAGKELSGLRARGLRDSGTRRYLLHPDDLPVAYAARVKVITFLPTLNLDEAIVQARFGTPIEVVAVDDRRQHWLYPDQGLDLLLDAEGRDLLQYLSPREYSAYRERLRQAAAAGQ
jgi:hypothetical protein